MKNPYTKLARDAVKTFLKEGKTISPPKNLPKKMTQKAGVFVSLHNQKDNSLRGCIGTFKPTKENIAQEIITNAIAASTQDPRFPPVKAKELPFLSFSVDILSASKKVSKGKLVDPKKHGLIVSTKDGRKGLLLPNIDGVNTHQAQFDICCRKAGIRPDEKLILETFTVKRYHE
jgi:AmmeMemoRadiSam system protein A